MFLFALMTQYENSSELEWHYNETQHREGPMDGVGGIIKHAVFGLVESKKITINSTEEFTGESSRAVPLKKSIEVS